MSSNTGTALTAGLMGLGGASTSSGIGGAAGPDNPIGYSGYVFNAETRVYTVRFRHYWPALGAWISRDPAGYVDGGNLYEYCGGMPTSFTDPTGLFWGELWDGIVYTVYADRGYATTDLPAFELELQVYDEDHYVDATSEEYAERWFGEGYKKRFFNNIGRTMRPVKVYLNGITIVTNADFGEALFTGDIEGVFTCVVATVVAGKVVKYIQREGRLIRIADEALEKATAKKLKGTTYKRPGHFRKGMREAAWERAKGLDGKVRDPLTGKEMNFNDPWDMGHKPGYEFRKHQDSAIRRGITREQFLDEYMNADHFRPELPASNQCHKGEDLTDAYYGP